MLDFFEIKGIFCNSSYENICSSLKARVGGSMRILFATCDDSLGIIRRTDMSLSTSLLGPFVTAMQSSNLSFLFSYFVILHTQCCSVCSSLSVGSFPDCAALTACGLPRLTCITCAPHAGQSRHQVGIAQQRDPHEAGLAQVLEQLDPAPRSAVERCLPLCAEPRRH